MCCSSHASLEQSLCNLLYAGSLPPPLPMVTNPTSQPLPPVQPNIPAPQPTGPAGLQSTPGPGPHLGPDPVPAAPNPVAPPGGPHPTYSGPTGHCCVCQIMAEGRQPLKCRLDPGASPSALAQWSRAGSVELLTNQVDALAWPISGPSTGAGASAHYAHMHVHGESGFP